MADTAPTHHNLDFMRSLAVAVVFIDHATLAAGINFFHSWDLRWLGDFGVYLFFVHTCLVLMWSLERRPHTLDFYVRRIFRIYPLAILTVSFIAITRFKAMYTPYPLFPSMVLSNLLLIQNLWQRPNIVGVLWSLPLELEMYVLLPALFIFARRESAVWPFILFWTFACFAAVATYGKDFGNGLYAVIPHFLPGVMAYIAFKHRKAVLPAWSFVAFLLVLLVCFEYVPGVKQGWLVCLIVGLTLPSFIDFRESLFTRLSHEIAKYSYGIYLLHPFATYIGFHMLWGRPWWIQWPLSLAITGGLAIPAYYLIEKPCISLGARVANRLQQRFGTNYKLDYGLDLA